MARQKKAGAIAVEPADIWPKDVDDEPEFLDAGFPASIEFLARACQPDFRVSTVTMGVEQDIGEITPNAELAQFIARFADHMPVEGERCFLLRYLTPEGRASWKAPLLLRILGHQTRDGIPDAKLTAAIGGFAAGWQMRHGGGTADMLRGIGQIARMLQ